MTDHRTMGATHRDGGEYLQGDLFTNEWQVERPKRGNGSHIRLKLLDSEQPIVPGMASYAGDGPKGKYCKDCGHFGEVAVQRTPDDIEMNKAGCVIYAQRIGHAAPTRRCDIRFCAACKEFEEAGDQTRRFIVDQAGAVHQVRQFPADLRQWRPETSGGSNALPGDVLPAASR